MSDTNELIHLIQGFGFSKVESEVYCYLLQRAPATGYRIAKGIGRSFTITYKAIEGLRDRGAVLVDEGGRKLARAVAIDEFLDQLETRFRNQRRQTLEAVKSLPPRPSDNRIYHIRSVAQVYERFRRMLSEAEERVLLELFPGPLEVLRDDVEACSQRIVNLVARVYDGESVAGARIVHSPYGYENIDRWKSQWLSLFVDGRQFLLANIANEGDLVYEAVWSANLVLARSFFSYVNSDFHHYAFAEVFRGEGSIEQLRKAYAELEEELPPGGDLGFLDLVSQFDTDGEI